MPTTSNTSRIVLARSSVRLMYYLVGFPATHRLFWHMVEGMDFDNTFVSTHDELRAALGMSDSTIARCVSKLKELGLVQTIKSASTTVYLISEDVVRRQ